MRKRSRISLLVLVYGLSALVSAFFASGASAATNQFRGVNSADSRDNFQSGVQYVPGLSSSDTYASALATGTSIMDQFVSELDANAVRMPINEATVSTFWNTYMGAIDAVLAKGKVVLGYWDSAKSNKPPDMNAFRNMCRASCARSGAKPAKTSGRGGYFAHPSRTSLITQPSGSQHEGRVLGGLGDATVIGQTEASRDTSIS